MVVIDDSECSFYALAWALQNLHSITKSKLVIFTAQPISDYDYLFSSTMDFVPPVLVMKFQKLQKEKAIALLEKAKEIFAEHGITATTAATEIGDPGDTICKAVEEFKVTVLKSSSVFIDRTTSISSYILEYHFKVPHWRFV